MLEEQALEILLNYGALGVIAIYLFLQNIKLQSREDKLIERLSTVIQNNTVAITKMYEVIIGGRRNE